MRSRNLDFHLVGVSPNEQKVVGDQKTEFLEDVTYGPFLNVVLQFLTVLENKNVHIPKLAANNFRRYVSLSIASYYAVMLIKMHSKCK